jgi:hypothetical protein
VTYLKDVATLADQDPNTDKLVSSTSDLDDFNLDIANSILLPLLAKPESLPNLDQHHSRVGETPTGDLLTNLVTEIVPLNQR